MTATSVEPSDDPIAVVGMGIAVPGASSPEQFWELLLGDHAVFREPGERLDLAMFWSADPAAEDRTYSRVAGFMTGFEPHPRLKAALQSAPVAAREYTAVWLRHCILQALEPVTVRPTDRHLWIAGLTPDGSHHLEQSLVVAALDNRLSCASRDVRSALAEFYPLAASPPDDVLPYRIARMAAADLPSSCEVLVVDTACSSSLYAIDLGARALRAGDADLALCGGAFALNVQSLVLFAKLHGLSRSGRVRALDRDADGVLFSDAAAVLALKRRSRAIQDGDRVLGFIAGFGASSDGRGKAIYAPNARGQRLALQRAWSAAGLSPSAIDWVIAHGTGTPTGDRTELGALAESTPHDRRWWVTSNKSLIGHSGWAAGAVSTVHALLAMSHESIPAQRHFTALPLEGAPQIDVPSNHVAWPATPDRPRTVGISAMGFGGTNGHLLITDVAPMSADQPRHPSPGDRVVVVAWGAHLPGDPDAKQIEVWLAGGEPAWPASFGPTYPLPSPVEARLAPSALAAMDRSQLMALRCADQIVGDWVRDPALAARTGVFVGYTGPTRSAVAHDLRCYLADVTAKLTDIDADDVGRWVRAGVGAPNEDSYPGLMPNIIAARVAQRFDLHGPNMTVDAGLDSVLSAIAAASRYLRDGELDVAIVLGISATTELVHGRDGREPAEAALGIVLTLASQAATRGMPAAFAVEPLHARAAGGSAVRPRLAGTRTYRGAEAAVALLRAMHAGHDREVIGPFEDDHTPPVLITRTAADARPDPNALARHALSLRPVRADVVRPPIAAIPAGALVVTDIPDAIAALKVPPNVLIASPPDGRDGIAWLAGLVGDRRFNHVRVIAGRNGFGGALADDRFFALHDLVFSAAQCNASSLDNGGSFAALVLDAFVGHVPRPHVGLLTGIARNLEQELPGCRIFALATDEREAAVALAQLEQESVYHRFLPAVFYQDGRRLELMLVPVGAAPASAALDVPPDPVVVATGGARGLTVHLIDQILADQSPRRLWLLGTGPLAELGAAAPVPSRADALRDLMSQYPGERIADLNRRYDLALHDAERVATIRQLQARFGEDRVQYRQCDVTDEATVRRTIAEIVARDNRVDVVLHGAGLVRTSVLARKKLADFRAVRDAKVRGYLNLRAALVDRHVALWCSLSSVSAFMGRRGEPDYGPANEFLMLAAAHAQTVEGRDEVALVSALWTESGMAAASTVGGAYLARQGDIGQMTNEQGRAFFASELRGRGSHGLATTWIGGSDWRTLERKAPSYRSACETTATVDPEPARVRGGSDRAAFLTTPPGRTCDGGTSWLVEIDLDRHRYLLDHLVDGRPTVPGTFILEIAAEAAAALAPDLQITGFAEVVLSHFIRAPRDRWPRRLEVTGRRDGSTVVVCITTPASGIMREIVHSRMLVRLGRSVPPGGWRHNPTATGIATSDPYHAPESSVSLGGVFGALVEPRLERTGGSASLRLVGPDASGVFESFRLPSVALDSLLRTAVLDGRRASEPRVMVPTGLGRVDLHVVANDVELARTFPEGIALSHTSGVSPEDNECTAVAPNGRVLFRVVGIAGVERR